MPDKPESTVGVIVKFREFPTIEFPLVLQRLGFNDRIWDTDSGDELLFTGHMTDKLNLTEDDYQEYFVYGPEQCCCDKPLLVRGEHTEQRCPFYCPF